jgi:hypothetical protein
VLLKGAWRLVAANLACVSRMLLRLLRVASVCSIPAPCTFRKVVASLLRWWSTSLTLRTCVRAQTRLLSQMTKPRRSKKYMWLLPVWLYQHLLWHFALVAKTWHVSCLSVQVANEWCLTVLHCLLTDRMKKFICFRRYRCVLPYTYGTFKAKCFRDGLHTCQRAGHSCMRKIVSFAGWPSRRRWRFVHKALETLVRSFVMSDEVWGLKDVCKVMDSRMSTACAHTCRSFTCGRCGKNKPPVVAFSADAG